MSDSSIWSIDRTLRSTTTPGQSGSESNDNEGVLPILQSSRTEDSSSDGLMSYPGHWLRGFLPLCREVVGVFFSPGQLRLQLYGFKYSNIIIIIQLIHRSLTGTTTPSQSGPGSNDNEEVFIPQGQNWSLTTGCSLVSYPRYIFCERS